MKLVLVRYKQDTKITRGVLQVVDKETCIAKYHSLELGWNANRNEISCIPDGTYKLNFEYSPSFERNLWELKGVPNRSETKIHPANLTAQLKGCIAIGNEVSNVGILDSKRAVDDLHTHLKPYEKLGLEIQIITV